MDESSVPDAQVLRPEHCLLVVEVMSPGSVTTDQVDKPGEYAAAGIAHFWRVELDGKATLFQYRLDPTTRTYASAGAGWGKLAISDPIGVRINLDALL